MKLFIKDNVIVWALPDDHPENNTENFQIVRVPNATPLTKSNEDGIPLPLTASEVLHAVNDLPYFVKRAFEYPPITDYIDGVVKGDQAQIQKYIDDCLAVKAKYPKE